MMMRKYIADNAFMLLFAASFLFEITKGGFTAVVSAIGLAGVVYVLVREG